MRKLIVLLLVIVTIFVVPLFVYADDIEVDFEPQITNEFNKTYSQEWGKNDANRAILAVSLFLDAESANSEISDMFDIDSLTGDACLVFGLSKNDEKMYNLLVLEKKNLLYITYNTSSEEASYSIISGASRSTARKFMTGGTWPLEPNFVLVASDIIMEKINN